MGFGGISIWQLLIILVIVILLFGTKKLRNIGGDLGGALKGFRGAMKNDEGSEKKEESEEPAAQINHDEVETVIREKAPSEEEKDKA